MKLSTGVISLVAATGLASAVPMRIVVLSEPIPYGNSKEVKANIVPMPMSNNNGAGRHPPCSKGMSFSNALRKALGLETIQEFKPAVIGPATGITFDRETYEGHTKGGDKIKVIAPSHHHHSNKAESTAARFHKAVMTLGPWEGRAVAFVIGCGLGVLLRIVFMILLLTYRAVTKSSNKEEEEVEEARDGEDYAVPPPNYNYHFVDEKAPIVYEVVEVPGESDREEEARK